MALEVMTVLAGSRVIVREKGLPVMLEHRQVTVWTSRLLVFGLVAAMLASELT